MHMVEQGDNLSNPDMSQSPSFSSKSEPTLQVDEKCLRQWVIAFCIIRFDLEQGQVIEETYPDGSLAENEELQICFNSFPDSVSQHHTRSSIHDCFFFYRIKRHKSHSMTSSEYVEQHDKVLSQNKKDGDMLMGINTGTYTPKFLYGYVFNRQRHDEKLKRGGEQKSVVVLSHSPFTPVFRHLLQILGPLYFDIGSKALSYIASYVSRWPSPVPGQAIDLLIGNRLLKVNLPPPHCLPSDSGVFEDSASSLAPLLPSNLSVPHGLFHESDLFGAFRGLLPQLWRLWELLLLGEPILIFAPTPSQCSEAVASLVSLAAPLLMSVDFRPYFTIHDPDFAKLNCIKDGSSFPPMVLGVTNLIFLKAFQHMPHIVSVGSATRNFSRPTPIPQPSSGWNPGLHEGTRSLSLRKFAPVLNALKKEGPLCLMSEHKEAMWSKYVAVTKPDTSILNRLVDAGLSPRVEESMSVVNNDILRRHFLELTTNFLAPFGPYFKANTPSELLSPFVDPPPLLAFKAEDFLANLSERGPGKFLLKRLRSSWLDLYRRFLKGNNFLPWFQRKRAVAEKEQCKLWRQSRQRIDIYKLITKMSELELVDCFHAIERNLQAEIQQGDTNADSDEVCKKLKKDLQCVFRFLSEDMQQLLLSSPERASLLQQQHK